MCTSYSFGYSTLVEHLLPFDEYWNCRLRTNFVISGCLSLVIPCSNSTVDIEDGKRLEDDEYARTGLCTLLNALPGVYWPKL